MWIVIIVLVVIGIIAFRIFDRDFIIAVKMNNGNYRVKFENGKEPVCTLVDVFDVDDNIYYVFIPIESLKRVPDEDIIVLKCLRKTDEKITLVFPEDGPCELIYHTVKKEYANKYNFM